MRLWQLILSQLISLMVFAGLASLPVWLLWNWALVPAIPVIQEIGWLQALGILILCSLLFKPSKSSKPRKEN